MLSATLKDGLGDYGIGAKIRALRLKKKMGLVELGQHSGLSPALLSKLERGRLFPTLPTLLRIALVFSVGLDYFFAGAREKPLVAVVRKTERVQLPERQDGKDMSYRFESLDYPATERRFNSVLRRVPSSGARPRPAALARGRGVHLHAQGSVERSHRRPGARARVRRLDVLRLRPSPWVPPRRHLNMLRHRRHDSLIVDLPACSPSLKIPRICSALKLFHFVVLLWREDSQSSPPRITWGRSHLQRERRRPVEESEENEEMTKIDSKSEIACSDRTARDLEKRRCQGWLRRFTSKSGVSDRTT